MNGYERVLLTLGEIKGEFAGFRTIVERVSRLELWQAFLKGAWCVLAYAFVWHRFFGH